MTEDEMVGWHHQLDGPEFEQAPEVGDDGEAWRAAVHRNMIKYVWLLCHLKLGYETHLKILLKAK